MHTWSWERYMGYWVLPGLACFGVRHEVPLFLARIQSGWGCKAYWLLSMRDMQRIDRMVSKITDPRLELIQSSARAHVWISIWYYRVFYLARRWCISKIPNSYRVDWVNQQAMGIQRAVYHGISQYKHRRLTNVIYVFRPAEWRKKKQGTHTFKTFIIKILLYISLGHALRWWWQTTEIVLG